MGEQYTLQSHSKNNQKFNKKLNSYFYS